MKRCRVLSFAILFFSLSAMAQDRMVTISGIVVDSISLSSLPNVSIKIKGTLQGTLTAENGAFILKAQAFDTLVFSSVGYRTLEYPLFGEEEEMIIRLRENYVLLKEVTVVSPHQDKYKIIERPIVTPSAAEGIFSPFTYFSRLEREKRRLIKIREDNQKVKTYVQMVNDPATKDDLMEKYNLKEKDYYEILAKFNQLNPQAAYLTDEKLIRKVLYNFFDNYAR